MFEPYLEKIVEVKREEAERYDLDGHIYNGLIDNFEEGMTVEKLGPIFDELKVGLIELLRKIESSDKYKMQVKKNYVFDRESQIKMSQNLLKVMGLSEESLRIDASEHPFTMRMGIDDVRITSNFEDGIVDNFAFTFHEAGHALYELNFLEEDGFNLLGDAPSYGLHESQAMFWEKLIGRGLSFQHYFFPEVKELFDLDVDFEEWYYNLNFVEEGKIRVSADEIHYCLHVILRFELEKGLIEGSIEVRDLPRIWNEKMKEYFDVNIENDSEGVLQDVHWSSGYFGYFPSYALGNVYAVQLYGQMKKDLPKIEGDIFEGDFKRVKDWLKNKIHIHGARKLADDIVSDVCGEGLNVNVYLDYLNEKYSRIYELK